MRAVGRLEKDRAFMAFARLMRQRSTCDRASVGAVITDAEGLQVLGIGFNGNAKGLPNRCDNPDKVGDCGCIHAEVNALLKSPGTVQGKILYVTTAPCSNCAKLILNGGITTVHYEHEYRTSVALDLLMSQGITIARHSTTSIAFERFDPASS